jgi:triphosphoribosyl-dephospho-CoA synthase
VGVPVLRRGLEAIGTLEAAIIFCHLHLMAAYPDSLVARKRGLEEAIEASRRAHAVLAAGWPNSAVGERERARLDDWLRAEGHSRNPGTTADLVTASLFVLLREGSMKLPSPFPWSGGAGHE